MSVSRNELRALQAPLKQQYGEDPSVNRLQEHIAELLGKEAALFVPSGTMANQIGLKLLTRPGDDVVVGDEAHIVWHESGAAAANSASTSPARSAST